MKQLSERQQEILKQIDSLWKEFWKLELTITERSGEPGGGPDEEPPEDDN